MAMKGIAKTAEWSLTYSPITLNALPGSLLPLFGTESPGVEFINTESVAVDNVE